MMPPLWSHHGGLPMAVNLSVKNVPDDIARSLRERAARNHRSLQKELLVIVEAAARVARPGEARAILEQLETARRLSIVPRSRDWATLPQLALDTGLTAYDAAYLSL